MKEICPEEKCTGCGLCMARCPKHCISMKPETLGHLYPNINQNECIDCRLCQKSCPSLHEISSRYPSKAYAAWSKSNEDYKSSTSGGAASVLSSYILNEGGVVYGCTVQPNIQITHIRVDKTENIRQLKGSKYVQSSITNVIPQIREDVKNGIKVLFIGTPCQVAAIRQMYKIQPDNLYLVDIICHGVPSNKWLSDYITKYLGFPKTSISDVKFRDLNAYKLSIYKKDKLLYQSQDLWTHRYQDLYMNAFFDGFISRDSCFNCPYAKPERISDITIGDFWGLGNEKSDAEIPTHPFGISCILPITAKGMELIDLTKEKLNIFERPVTEAINGNSQLRHPSDRNFRINVFRSIYKSIGINRSYRLCVGDKILKQRIKKLINRK